MKIFGIGTDIVKVSRIKKFVKKKTFITRLFNKQEVLKCKKTKNPSNCFAKRFAAKEAFSKSFGTGIRGNLSFKDIEILNDKMGKPFFYKSKKIDQIVKKKFKIKKYDLLLSLSDEEDHSIAFTILIKK